MEIIFEEEKEALNRIIEKQDLSENVVRMVLEAPTIAQKRRAGQFIILKIDEKGERIPLTIVDSDTQEGTITIIFQIVGKTTAAMAKMKVGDAFRISRGRLEIRRRSRISVMWSASAAASASAWFILWLRP